MSTCYLVLETGDVFKGEQPFVKETYGEVVFNTSSSGYEEVVTDTSYFQQIVVMTSPMQGNYGVNETFWESSHPQVKGFICLRMQNTKRDNFFLKMLEKYECAVMTHIDTRALVLKLRDLGTVRGVIVPTESESIAKEKASHYFSQPLGSTQDWVSLVSRKEIDLIKGFKAGGPRVGLLDLGVKNNIIRELQNYCETLVVFPASSQSEVIRAHHIQALILSNGPGDPADVAIVPQTIKKFIGEIPIFGICMGHQLLARALGGKTYKLKFGHRGGNHPIKDKLLNRVYVASHNHGYAVDPSQLIEQGVEVTHINLNDNTCAGLANHDKKYMSVQFHPESCPGPYDSKDLFRYFFREMVT